MVVMEEVVAGAVAAEAMVARAAVAMVAAVGLAAAAAAVYHSCAPTNPVHTRKTIHPQH